MRNLTRCSSSEFSLLRWMATLCVIILFRLLKDNAYTLISNAFSVPIVIPSKKKKALNRPDIALRLILVKLLAGDRSIPIDEYRHFLSRAKVSSRMRYDLMQRFMSEARIDFANATAEDLINQNCDPFFLENRLEIYRVAGITCFLLGQNSAAIAYWRTAGELRKLSFKPSTPTRYRVLSSNWFAAVGHVAMLDYYLKYIKLYGEGDTRIVTGLHSLMGCSVDMMRKFSDLGIVMLNSHNVERDYNKWALKNGNPKWHELSRNEQEALTDDFWEFAFPDGSILGYTHWAARIQKEWELSGHPPLLQVTTKEEKWLATYLQKLGIPSDAWYVCLHVREGGYHKKWNSALPTMRDAEIEDYFPAIQEIVREGGWVIRMGDPSMKKLPPMNHVVDYAHCDHRDSLADMLLAARCRFFLGTNSGFATVPAIFGVPCAFSNWIPIGWPLWPSQDLMMCKLFRLKSTQRLLALEEIFERGLAFLQNWSDLPEDIEIVNNTPEDIRRLTAEMLSCFGSHSTRSLAEIGAPSVIQNAYAGIASRYDTYTGSRLAGSFVETYPAVFTSSEREEIRKCEDEPIGNTAPVGI